MKSHTASSLLQWKLRNLDKKAHLDFLMERLQRLNLFVTTDGVWIETLTEKKVNRAHLVCILRAEYRAQNFAGGLDNKALEMLIVMLLNGIERASVMVIEKDKSKLGFISKSAGKDTLK